MKAYTDLEQSKRLAEILPLESADHHYVRKTCDFMGNSVDGKWSEPKYGNTNSKYAHYIVQNFSSYETLPAWSLAALLELLPKRIEIVDNVYELSIYLYGIYYWNINNGNLCFKSKDKDSLVDACYEAIVFLHEQKLL